MSFFKKLMILFGISLIAFYGCDKLLGPDPRDSSQNDEEISITGPSFLLVIGDEYTIDFEEFQTGEVVDEINLGSAGIVGVSGSHSTSGSDNVAIVFNSSVPSGGDFDLGSPNEVAVPSGPGVGAGGESGPFINDLALGKILILAENMIDVNPDDGFIDDPDDSGDLNGFMAFDFSGVGDGWATVIAGMVIDVEHTEQVPNIIFHLKGGGTVNFIYPSTGNNGLYKGDTFIEAYPNGIAEVVLMEVFFHGSGGIDNIIITPKNCTGLIGDFVWHDLNENGIQDQDEPGLPDVTVKLELGGQTIQTTTTDSTGHYLFEGLCAGQYKVIVDETTLPAEAPQTNIQSTDNFRSSAPVSLKREDLTIKPGKTFQNSYKSEISPSRLNNQSNTAPQKSIITDDNDNYTPEAEILETVTLNWIQTLIKAGSDRGKDSNNNPANVRLKDGQIKLKVDFGYYLDEIIARSCYLDIEKYTNGFDADFAQDAPKLPIGSTVNWTYEVTNTGDTSGDPDAAAIKLADIVVTDNQPGVVPVFDPTSDVGSDGLLSPGETWIYRASGTVKDLDGSVYENVGSVNAFVVGSEEDTTYCDAFDLSHYINCDGLIGDFVWFDQDCNGIQDGGEPGLEGVKVYLKLDNVLIDSTTTNSSGYYEFADLCAGQYKVIVDETTLPDSATGSVTFPVSWSPTAIKAGTDRAKDSNNNPANVKLNDGQVKLKVDFGYCEEIEARSCYLDIEKYTNGVDADLQEDAPRLFPGNTVTWTYEVTNTGDTSNDPDAAAIALADITVTDDQPGVVPVRDASTDVGSDGMLSPGETWVYEATGTVQDLQGGVYENVGSVNAFVVTDAGDTTFCDAFDLSHYVNEDCGDCVNQFTEMTFQYTGSSAELVTVYQNKPAASYPPGVSVFSQIVQPGEQFTIYGTWDQHDPPSLGTEVYLYVDGVLNGDGMHTSCSDPAIVPGYQEGDFLIISIRDRSGQWICETPD